MIKGGRVKKAGGAGQKRTAKVFGSVTIMAIWVFCAIIASQFLIGFAMIAILGSEKFEQPVWTAIFSALAYSLALVLIILVPAKLSKKWRTDRRELGLLGLPTWTDIGLAPVGFVVGTLLGAVLAAIFSIFPWFNVAEVQETGFNIYIVGADRIIAFVTLVVIAPIAEEIIFRGWMYGKLREKMSERFSEKVGMVLSILIVSVLFGLVHLQWNVGVNVFALSVVLCGLREITGTIYAGIITHIIKNGVAFYLLYVLGVN